MQPCGECSVLEGRLRSANQQYVSLILRQHRIMLDGNHEARAFEDAIQEAQDLRTAIAYEVLVHGKLHDLSRPRAEAAGQP